MERVIYCPSDELLEKASDISKKNYLPIIVGDNDHTKNLEFDREKISIVSIPEHKGYTIFNSIKKGFHQNIKYKNEFIIIKNKINLFINNELIKPMYEESHIAKFVYLCKESGDYSCKIIVDEKVEEEFSFVVD
jgi:Fe-S cluster biosynthesis and repair protein YggX